MSALLEVENARVVLGGRAVVSAATFGVARGEIVALLGPNGAGKSSLLRASLGLLPLERGWARLFGADPAEMAPDLRARRAAYLPQQAETAWPVSVEALVALGRFAHGAAPQRLALVDRDAVETALDSCGLAYLRARRMDEISGGERVRAHVARALAQQAALLMLDEPTAGLDPAQSLQVAALFAAHARKDGGVLFTTHDVTLAARIATKILLMREGRVLAQGEPREVLRAKNLQDAYGRAGRLIEIDGALAVVFD